MKNLGPDLLNEIVRRLVEALHPKKIYLFGSHAYGQPNDDSDVDLLIIVKDSDQPINSKIADSYQSLWGLCIPKDILVVTQSQFDKRSRWLSSIERVVMEKGKLLYESESG